MAKKRVEKVQKVAEKKVANLCQIDHKILNLLKDNPEGLRQKTISKLLNIKERTCYNHLKALKDKKFLKNLYPIWKIWRSSDLPIKMANLPSSSKTSEGHHIAWLLPLVRKPSWWNKRKDRLMKLKDWHFKKEVTANNNIYHQIYNDYMQIQTYKNSIYFICNEYYTNSDLETYLKSKDDVLEAIRYLEEIFRFKFIAEGNFHLICLTPHYVTMKEALAEHFRKDGERFVMETKEGYKLVVDFSEPFGLESDNLEVKRRYLRIVKDYQDNPNLPLPSEIHQIQAETGQNLKILSEMVAFNQKELPGILVKLEKQINSHLKLIQEYRKENVAWRKAETKKIREELKQRKLGDFT